jgi:hypothetical protein
VSEAWRRNAAPKSVIRARRKTPAIAPDEALQEDIFWLDVEMHDPSSMSVGKVLTVSQDFYSIDIALSSGSPFLIA